MDESAAASARSFKPANAIQGQLGADEQTIYVINTKQIAKFVVGLGNRVAAMDIEEGMRVGYVTTTIREQKQWTEISCWKC